ncbi:MAG: 2-amino-4-hydroxy-6-hydroxymethyldihydropteridine diphosphokinase [Planctomycetota bacterium]
MSSNARFALLLLGSNINPDLHLKQGFQLLGEQFSIHAKSPIYQSPPVGAPGTSDYLNQAVTIDRPPVYESLRSQLRAIEDQLGRIRTTDLNSPRTMDIDILTYADEDLQMLLECPIDEALKTLHHAAIPASMIASDWRFPNDEKTIGEASRSLGPAPTGFLTIS